jgi:hypothetical protein
MDKSCCTVASRRYFFPELGKLQKVLIQKWRSMLEFTQVKPGFCPDIDFNNFPGFTKHVESD